MAIPTEQIGSFPRPPQLIAAITAHQSGNLSQDALDAE
jgi:methionine synthase II (cobalamin-independent)